VSFGSPERLARKSKRVKTDAAETTSLAKVQGWFHMIGAILFPAGVAVVPLREEAIAAGPVVGR
jgi:hypothetical protein